MKRYVLLMLLWPAFTWANEAAPAHSSEAKPSAKPATNSSGHAPIKNAPPTQVDNLKPVTKPKAEKTESANAEASTHGAKPSEASAHGAKPTEPPVVQYVPPKYTSSAPLVRQYVPSKAPKAAAHSASTGKIKSSHASAKTTRSEDMSVTPGLVRVLPSSSLPAGKVLPAAKLATDSGSGAAADTSGGAKPRLIWGDTTVVKPAAMPEPQIYIVKDPELRWQQYSYP